jgi:hypothetical protein
MKSFDQYFRSPDHSLFNVSTIPPIRGGGFFKFGSDCVCFGATSSGVGSKRPDQQLVDLETQIRFSSGQYELPFDPDEVVSNLSQERYMRAGKPAIKRLANLLVRKAYYAARPLMPLGFRSRLQEIYLQDWQTLRFPNWPVDTTIDDLMRKLMRMAAASDSTPIPFIWFWPDGANACAVMTHDVEEEAGRAFCSTLMDINEEYAIPASFQVVPEKRYEVSREYLAEITSRAFEVNVQDLNHDGRLYWDFAEFERRVVKINRYGRDWDARGFRAAILYRNEEWFDMLDFEYDMSIPNVAHLDPQRGGCCTVMPYFIGNLLELPVTTTQDHSLFHIIREYSLDWWKRQIAAILERNGLISFIVHPDYIIEDRARGVYRDLLAELSRLRDEENVWIALPRDVNRWWRERSAMTLQSRDGQWVVDGPGKERARVAFASVDGNKVVFNIPQTTTLSN